MTCVKFSSFKATEITTEYFADHFMKKNEPCLITDYEMPGNAKRDWVQSDNSPNWEFLQSKFGTSVVPVSISDVNGNIKCINLKLEAWLSQIRSPSHGNEQWYLKDWHFVQQHAMYKAYTTPEYVNDDWLNLYWDQRNEMETNVEKQNDYRFVYIGKTGTKTPMHHDVFYSNSWSFNVCGEKHWILVPPSDSDMLKDELGNVLSDIQNVDEKVFPLASAAKLYHVIQPPNSFIFVPSGWFHQVENTMDTISINHNWFNRYNISLVTDYLLYELELTRKAISDCRTIFDTVDLEWEGLCQTVLKANCGISIQEFIDLLAIVRANRLECTVDTEKVDEIMNILKTDSGIAELYALNA